MDGPAVSPGSSADMQARKQLGLERYGSSCRRTTAVTRCATCTRSCWMPWCMPGRCRRRPWCQAAWTSSPVYDSLLTLLISVRRLRDELSPDAPWRVYLAEWVTV